MEFRTEVSIPRAAFDFSYQDETMLIGSCFAENIGGKMEENKLAVDVNPFGVLYNPASIAQSLKMLLHPAHLVAGDLFEYEGVYHSFTHHSRFSSHSEAESLDKINHRLAVSSANLGTVSRLIVTFGTAYVYRLKRTGEVVSNCHKLPEKLFTRERLSAGAIVDEWNALLLSLWEQNPELKILFTVSPVRHWKDGAHHNQLSKASLLLAVDELQNRYPDRIAYFPAYEIVMDELRDYRFYADDMLHPSPLAVAYIWERFTASFLSAESQQIMKEWQEVQKAINHKPFQPESETYRRFISQTLLKAEQINNKFPYIHIENEIELLRSKMK
ncbi:hypothetical protein M2459_003608 [Parabacteroides sp. PF5-5]|uniref:GSCFA domain-containing protein n=1 Tax=unclassified Parabacteroides TaxID=2649774 RepID=UPI002475C70C|nr:MULTISPECIES: GSCFA domain-containing protein [unclassified Parabacteroides]MDH6306959.1 hypothetical protein [Parabacteroides sp. PH5-39]MDH6317833.1 hypothetical protein [Parabacteroides sp. PF5-13]MDH6321564.1 hypothetical protein [Parabacteroides sp. PH5-13]MDH6325360.1 hypothetical protein [Parabacteroides sp. PH5-8]MDH6329031.1 hypothetical protein [Parabacteroides sp. PH5-41]